MAKAIIKKEHLRTIVAFGKSGLPLGQRNDIDELAILAVKSKDPSLIGLFEYLPTLQELQSGSVEEVLKDNPIVLQRNERLSKRGKKL